MRESKREETKEKVSTDTEDTKTREEKLDRIKEEMADNKTKSNEKNEKKYKEAIKNISIGCGIIIYFAILLFGKGKISYIDYIKALKVVIICDLISSLILLEVAFSKDKFNIGLHGIEMAFVGGFTIFILDLYSKMVSNFNVLFSIIIVFVTVYYMVKSTIIAVKKKKE